MRNKSGKVLGYARYLLFISCLFLSNVSAQTNIEPVPALIPNKYQQEQIQRKYGMFIHFGINTFLNEEWTDGSFPASIYKPTTIDAKQWVKTAKDAGMKYIILVTKHHDGFCLWDSKYTEYDVANSGNKTNVVEEVAKECKKQGIRLGLYYSLWDRKENADTKNESLDAAYNRYMINHLNELIDITSKYTPIVEFWFDGTWEKKGYRWDLDKIYTTIKSREPQCQIGINWTIGKPDDPKDENWQWHHQQIYPDKQKEGDPIRYFPGDFRLGDPYLPAKPDPKLFSHDGKTYYLPWESTVCMSSRWFYHTEDTTYKSVDELMALYKRATAQDNILILNCPPNREGKMRTKDVELLKQLQQRIKASIPTHLEIPGVFTDNMVLQRQTEAPVWGKTVPGRNVKVITSWDHQVYQTTADSDGSWKVKVKTPQAGGPYQVTVSDGKDKEIRLKNVLIGEVWVCSGQSNMEMPLGGWGKINNYEQEIANADHPQIRLLHVEKATSTQPLDDVKTMGGWQICSPATISEFSSVAYFFGRNLNQTLNIPIGLINASWGGTLAEAWTSGDALENMPDFKDAVQELRTIPENQLQAIYQQKFEAWNAKITNADEGLKYNWTNPDLNDSDWKTMNLPGLWEEKELRDFDGIVWFRKTVEIPASWDGRNLELRIGMADDNDITYFNGQEIGRTEGYNVERIYQIPAKAVKAGKAVIVVRVTDTGGGGGIYGETGNMRLTLQSDNKENVQSLAGDWKYKVAIDLNTYEKAPQSQAGNPNRPSVLFNGMLNPLVPYAMQGAIWYQGEANESKPEQYRELLPLLIRDWRKQWNRDFPFYYVQLTDYKNTSFDWPKLREAQFMTLHLENTAMVVSMDIGNPDDIHPKNKQDVGLRLALAARANTYGEKIIYSGPLYDFYQIEGDKIRVTFKHNQGLKAKGDSKLKGFEMAGSDHKFYPADAVIEGNEIVVSSRDVKFPVAVRYAWANSPVCNLYNAGDLPASPFRTDDWK